MIKRTKIVATIGPATGTPEFLKRLVDAGVNVCRLNFSHGTHEEHAQYIANIRALSASRSQPIAILQDLQGPKMRVGTLPAEGRVLKDGERVVFTVDESTAGADKIFVDCPGLISAAQTGQALLLDDGLLEVTVERVEGNDIITRVVHGGTLFSHKGLNTPQTRLPISAMSEKDHEDVRFGVQQGVDWIALSFVRSAHDLQELRELIHAAEEELGKPSIPPIKILAKIEKPEAIEHLEEIVHEADAVMVARGDLGIEMPIEQIPALQKRIIDTARHYAKPVIVATQMLDSMIRNPRPTRAEVTDIAGAVTEGVDATMLSGETASGKYPVEAVEIMRDVIAATESAAQTPEVYPVASSASPNEAMSSVAGMLTLASQAKAIIVASPDGELARFVARERARIPTIAVSHSPRVCAQMVLCRGVEAVLEPSSAPSDCFAAGIAYALKQSVVTENDEVIVVASEGNTDAVFVELRKARLK